MAAKKNICLLVALALLSGCSGSDPAQCQTKDACMTDRSCQCWCSVKCGFRNKEASDHPVYIANDPNGKYCYCKQWDADHYEDNCVKHLNVKEPKGAQ